MKSFLVSLNPMKSSKNKSKIKDKNWAERLKTKTNGKKLGLPHLIFNI